MLQIKMPLETRREASSAASLTLDLPPKRKIHCQLYKKGDILYNNPHPLAGVYFPQPPSQTKASISTQDPQPSYLHLRCHYPSPFIPLLIPSFYIKAQKNSSLKKMMTHSLDPTSIPLVQCLKKLFKCFKHFNYLIYCISEELLRFRIYNQACLKALYLSIVKVYYKLCKHNYVRIYSMKHSSKGIHLNSFLAYIP